ncbi:MAG: hypothetical protein WEB04_08325 [Dehalococcoidia bacterium]
MRQLLDDVTMIYRQELDSFLTMIVPMAVLGPVLVVVATGGFIPTLVAVPALLLLTLLTYSACLRAAALILRNLSPDPSRAWIEALRSAPAAIMAAMAPALALAACVILGVRINEFGIPFVGLVAGLAGPVLFARWSLRHAYDESLVLAHDMPSNEATRVGPLLAVLDERWTAKLLTALAAPLVIAMALSWIASFYLTPLVGGALFVVAMAFWLPLPALALTIDCDRVLAEATEPAHTAPATASASI